MEGLELLGKRVFADVYCSKCDEHLAQNEI